MAKKFIFSLESNAKTVVTSINFVECCECCVFDGNIRIQEKMAINSDASEFTLPYRCHAKFLTSHHVQMHRVTLDISNTLRKL